MNEYPKTHRFRTLAAGLLLALGAASAGGADGTATEPELRYRRQLVPESEVESRVQQGYMAMRRERFAQMLAEINDQSADRSGRPVVRVQRAVYTARWEAGQLVHGEAELDIHLSGAALAPLTLSPMEVAITRPLWTDDPTRSPVLGLDSRDQIVLLVERSATLTFGWSLRAHTRSSGGDVFRLRFPPCAASELRLVLPANMQPVLDSGFVQPLESAAGEAADADVWLLQLRGESPADLRIVPREPPAARRQIVLTRQSSRYGLTSAGLEYQTTFSLDVHNAPLTELALEVDPELKVLGARLDRVDVAIRVVPDAGATSADGTTGTPPNAKPSNRDGAAEPARLPQTAPLRMLLELPAPLQGVGRELVVTAFAPLVVDAPWRLPSVRPVAAIWQQGTATLDVPQSILLKRLGLEAGVEAAVEPVPLPLQGESRRLLLYHPMAAITVTLGHAPKQVALVSGTTLRLNPSLVTARQVVQLTGTHGATFGLEGRIQSGWIVDNIEASSSDALVPISPWTVRGRRLRIHFKEGLTPDRSVQLTITAHRHVQTLPLGGSELRIVEFERVGQRRELIAVCPDERHHLVVHRNADVPRLVADSLPAVEKPLIDAMPGALIYLDSPPAKDFLVGVNFENPWYAGTIDTAAYVEARSLRQTYRIRVEPAGSQVSRLLVHFSQQDASDTHWRLVADTGSGLVTRELPPSEDDAGETWELTLVRARGEPFEIEAVRLSAFESSAHVALASLPEAVSQSATLKIGAADGSPLSVQTENLKSIPVERPAPTEYTKVRAAYRYDPARNAVALISRADATAAQHAAWAWQADLVTRLDGHGEATNVVVYRLENTGRSQVAVALPLEARLWRITVDGLEIPAETSGKPPRPLFVRLPRDVRFPTLQIRYAAPHPSTGILGTFQPEWPTLDVPCLSATWSVWLPSAYAVWPRERLLPQQATPRWDHRLFGYPLLRRLGRPFDLFSAADWQSVVGAMDPRGLAEVDAEAVLMRMQATYARLLENSNRVPTWGELLGGLGGMTGKVGQPLNLCVDPAGLRDVGVTSGTPIDIGEGQSPWNPQDLLAATGVALVVSSDNVVLTSRDRLGRFERAAAMPYRNAASLADAVGVLEDWPGGSPPVPVADWAAALSLVQSPWSPTLESQLLDLPLTGWHNVRAPSGSSNAGGLTIYQPRYLEVLGSVLLLGVAGLAATFLRNHRFLVWLGIGGFAVLTLLCPVAVVPVARGIFLGWVLGAAWTVVPWIPRMRGPLGSTDSSVSQPSSNRGLAATALPALLLGVLLLVARSAISAEAIPLPPAAGSSGTSPSTVAVSEGESPPATPAAAPMAVPPSSAMSAREPYPLVCPVDDEGQPAGSYVYMPRAFYEALYRLLTSPRPASQSWLLQSAAYRVSLGSADSGSEIGDSPRVLADFTVAVLEAGTTIRLPLSRAEVTVLDATLDGQTVPPLWDEAGTSLSFPVESSRQVRLALVLRPRIHMSDRAFELAISIPPLPRSSLLVQAAALEGVEVPHARGSVQRDVARQEIAAELGPANRLVVRWPVASTVRAAASEVTVSQLLLLRVHPNSVVLDARFDFQIQSGVLQQVELLTDPRLQLLPLPPGSPVLQYETQAGNEQRIRLDLDRPYVGELTIRASFLVNDVSGTGLLTPPQVEMNARRSGPEWFAVWVAPGLEISPPSEPRAAAQTLAEFQSLWGGLDVAPQYVARLNPAEPLPAIAVQPVTARTESREALDVTVASDQLTLAFRAALNMRTGAYLQQRLMIPARLSVEDVQVQRDGVNRVSRWADDGRGTLTVFFNAPLSGQYELSLRGSMPTIETLPFVTTAEAEVVDYQCRIFRRTGVGVTVAPGPGWRLTTDDSSGQYDARLGRLVATLVAQGPFSADAAPTRLGVALNRPLASGELATRLDYLDGQWWVEVDLRAHVERGELDSLRFLIPDAVASDIRLEPAWPLEIIASLEPHRRIVIVRPPASLTGEARVKLRAELNTPPEEPVRAPEIQVPDIAELRRSIILPTLLGSQQIAWETSGLRSVTEEPGDADPLPTQTVFQVVGQNPQAVVADVERVTGAPQIHLADISLAWQLDGTYRGVAAYDLEPARITELEIVLPSQVTLIQCFAAGLPVTAVPDGERRWKLPLGPEQWPQRVEILFTGQIGRTADGTVDRLLAAPTIGGLPISRTIWSVQAPPEAGEGYPRLTHTAVSPLEHARIRLETAQSLLQSAPAVVARSSVHEAAVWRQEWQQRVAAAQREVDWREAAHRARERTAGLPETVPIAVDPDRLLQSTENSPTSSVFSSVQGASSAIQIGYRDGHREDRSRRLLIAALLVGGLAGGAVLGRSALVRDGLVRLPYVAMALTGAIWWLFLNPSLLGLGIVLLAVWGALRRPAGSVR